VGIKLERFSEEDHKRLVTNMFTIPEKGIIKVSARDWNEWTDDVHVPNEVDLIIDSEGIAIVGTERSVFMEMVPSKSRRFVRNNISSYMKMDNIKSLGFVVPKYESRVSESAMKETEEDVLDLELDRQSDGGYTSKRDREFIAIDL
jgi:hypothetical protein